MCTWSCATNNVHLEITITFDQSWKKRWGTNLAGLHVLLAVSHEGVHLAHVILHELDHERHGQISETILPGDLHQEVLQSCIPVYAMAAMHACKMCLRRNQHAPFVHSFAADAEAVSFIKQSQCKLRRAFLQGCVGTCSRRLM